MSWKWRYRDHLCCSQNLPQNICNYYINELIFELSSWWQRAKQLGPDEADEDQTGTNRWKLCFALPTHILPVRRWDKMLLRKLNPRQTTALDHYKSHPQIFVVIRNFEDYQTFLLLPTAEIGSCIFFFVLQHIPFGFQSSAASTPSSFQMWSSAFLLKNYVGQGSAWSLSWRELSICFSTL